MNRFFALTLSMALTLPLTPVASAQTLYPLYTGVFCENSGLAEYVVTIAHSDGYTSYGAAEAINDAFGGSVCNFTTLALESRTQLREFTVQGTVYGVERVVAPQYTVLRPSPYEDDAKTYHRIDYPKPRVFYRYVWIRD